MAGVGKGASVSLDVAKLREFQDSFVALAKDMFLGQERLLPFAAVLCYRLKGAAFAKREDVRLIFGSEPELSALPNEAVCTFVTPLHFNWEQKFHILVSNGDARTRAVLKELVAVAIENSVDEPHMRVVRPFMQVTGLNEKDIQAMAMAELARGTSAFAILMVQEGYFKYGDAHPAGSLRDDASAKEGILAMLETRQGSRLVHVPVLRDSGRRDVGAVVRFDDAKIFNDHLERDLGMKGRFAQLLAPLE